jgi:hypothetical protein
MDSKENLLQMEKTSGFLHARTAGIRSRESVKNISHEVFAAAREKDCSKVLIDVRELTGSFGFTDITYLVREVLQELNGKGIEQVAVIDIKRTVGLGWFLETVSQSSGLNIRVFDDEASAKKWFCEEK